MHIVELKEAKLEVKPKKDGQRAHRKEDVKVDRKKKKNKKKTKKNKNIKKKIKNTKR